MKKVVFLTNVLYKGDRFTAGKELEVSDVEAKKLIAAKLVKAVKFEKPEEKVEKPEDDGNGK